MVLTLFIPAFPILVPYSEARWLKTRRDSGANPGQEAAGSGVFHVKKECSIKMDQPILEPMNQQGPSHNGRLHRTEKEQVPTTGGKWGGAQKRNEEGQEQVPPSESIYSKFRAAKLWCWKLGEWLS